MKGRAGRANNKIGTPAGCGSQVVLHILILETRPFFEMVFNS